jgi:hypothetical protein
MLFDVVPAERMKLAAVSALYVTFAAERLVHIGNILLVPVSYFHDSRGI